MSKRRKDKAPDLPKTLGRREVSMALFDEASPDFVEFCNACLNLAHKYGQVESQAALMLLAKIAHLWGQEGADDIAIGKVFRLIYKELPPDTRPIPVDELLGAFGSRFLPPRH